MTKAKHLCMSENDKIQVNENLLFLPRECKIWFSLFLSLFAYVVTRVPLSHNKKKQKQKKIERFFRHENHEACILFFCFLAERRISEK